MKTVIIISAYLLAYSFTYADKDSSSVIYYNKRDSIVKRFSLYNVKDSVVRMELEAIIQFNNMTIFEDVCGIKLNNNKIKYNFNDKEIILSIKHFTSTNHTIRIYDSSFIEIDNKVCFGAIFQLPEYEISTIEIKNGNRCKKLASNIFDDIYNPGIGCVRYEEYGEICYSRLFLSKHNNAYICVQCGDGGGACLVIFILKGLNYYDRVIHFQ